MTFPYISDMMYENISKLVAMKKVTRTLNNITLKNVIKKMYDCFMFY